jgi:FtsZ-binding cell division protein ZapB
VSRRLWNKLYDQIVQEDKAIQEELEKEVTRLDQREKGLIQENSRIKKQLAAAQEEKWMLLGRLYEIETQLNTVRFAVFSNSDKISIIKPCS